MPQEGPFNAAAIRRRRARAAGRLRDEGLSVREIGERLGVTHVTVITDLASLSAFPFDIPDEESPDDRDPIRLHG